MNISDNNENTLSEARKRYADIIDLPHHEPQIYRRMSISARSAQFAPFSALAGHDKAIEETARWTDEMEELAEDSRQEVNDMLSKLRDMLHLCPIVKIKCFVSDKKKDGGEYKCFKGTIKVISETENTLTMQDGVVINLCTISEISIED